ncbi:TIGR01620 family protein [Brucella pseudogrignonensis]|uniref:YcjF family protein n=1 Tax=Brucella/Ochrobactrum group TaxID=2826938 RepID=UPI0007DA9822|nr:TIGR01620 family protein [Brucella pseudogrignonensis]MBK0021012.1 TIGR01620 family protein [Ochrobactrum sp. S45]MBK0042250.1 TIGR01620 family protein [Ochrobactrum sp. S46]QWK78570.1 TIGR01620 family protein [Ochrobactrum sp. BTU1]ANG95862.1 TIGR01620 family protein [Brucella pseudogrignonensis]UKK93460.1 TIGR01620 family protein [Brucella pseudogrignonensis]
MSEQPPRKPAAFTVQKPTDTISPSGAPNDAPRRPRAVTDLEKVIPEVDVFALTDEEAAELEVLDPSFEAPPRRRWSLSKILFGALGILVSFAIGIWTEDLIQALFTRADWLGWTALGVAMIALASFIAIIVRELIALRRLASVQHLRKDAADAAERDDMAAARKAVDELRTIAAGLPETARGRQMLDGLTDEIIDGRNLIRLAETEILKPLDREARALILNASKRVSIVTAISPRALVDIGYVIFESARLIRRLSQLYGGRPGTLGFLKLARRVVAHLAVTGTIAMGDSVIQQLIGHGLASRLSAKLGEGVVNGLMTARIGIAAMDVVRPFPFNAEKRPGVGDFIGDIARINGEKVNKPTDRK